MIVKLEEGLELTNPKIKIQNSYLEVLFIDEQGEKHSRFLKVDLSSVNITDAVNSNELLKEVYV